MTNSTISSEDFLTNKTVGIIATIILIEGTDIKTP